ncbi:sugar ABC transporter substrate-binding protein [Laedolimicola sp.]|uniref:sugar ABC transporter substrate-binding protein n=1 Tax=Laedolimicola sp. TaxID=2981663 RepID=UPI003F8037BF
MKKNKQIWLLVLILLLGMGVSVLIMATGQKEDTKYYTVSVVVNNSGSSRWTSLKEGAEAAAKDYNIRLKYVATGEFWGKQNELEILSREQEAGVDGMIVQMYASEGVYEKLESLLPKEKCVLLETDIAPEEYYQTVGPDNKELGQVLAERICQDFGGELKGKTIGILSGNTGQIAMRQRLQGLQEKLLAAGAQVQWQMAEMGRNPDQRLLKKNWAQGADIVVALENDETERAVDYLNENPEILSECALYGIGNSEKVVYYLDKGMIRALLAPNEFHMGYQSVEELAKKLEYHAIEKRNVTTGYLLIDKDSLYDTENQKILFPIVQ